MNIVNCFICNKPLIKSEIQSFGNLITYVCYVDDKIHCQQHIDIATEETRYYVINLEDFYIYYYCDNNTPENSINPKNTVYVYHNEFPRGECIQSPFLRLPTDKVDLNKITSYNHKWKVLRTFS